MSRTNQVQNTHEMCKMTLPTVCGVCAFISFSFFYYYFHSRLPCVHESICTSKRKATVKCWFLFCINMSTQFNITIKYENKYLKLQAVKNEMTWAVAIGKYIRQNFAFYNVSICDVDVGLFRGIDSVAAAAKCFASRFIFIIIWISHIEMTHVISCVSNAFSSPPIEITIVSKIISNFEGSFVDPIDKRQFVLFEHFAKSIYTYVYVCVRVCAIKSILFCALVCVWAETSVDRRRAHQCNQHINQPAEHSNIDICVMRIDKQKPKSSHVYFCIHFVIITIFICFPWNPIVRAKIICIFYMNRSQINCGIECGNILYIDCETTATERLCRSKFMFVLINNMRIAWELNEFAQTYVRTHNTKIIMAQTSYIRL